MNTRERCIEAIRSWGGCAVTIGQHENVLMPTPVAEAIFDAVIGVMEDPGEGVLQAGSEAAGLNDFAYKQEAHETWSAMLTAIKDGG